MENLNDAEFGSDAGNEEAPILVAQRYLNIFRQVHIFNKAKRDEFDDELLALPQNITDFFKKMPGGRLLVEHIEKVKTERGIAFVKSNKEDFDEGAGKTDTPTQYNGPMPVFQGGGTMVLDASFAETLAQSLAEAFKQIPSVASNTNVATSGNLGGAFDAISEEIRTSRSSLLDVLKETRSITDSVIASQVSISRILESLLSSRNRDDSNVTALNNKIIASQASITKLLEGLYTTHTQQNSNTLQYSDVENQLQQFRQEIYTKVDSSLERMNQLFVNYTQEINNKNNAQLQEAIKSFSDIIRSQQVVSSFQQNTHISQPNVRPVQTASFVERETVPQVSLEEFSNPHVSEFENDITLDAPFKKKKKKKKNRDQNNGLQQQNIAVSENRNIPQPVAKTLATIAPTATISDAVAQEDVPAFDGVIRNQAYKHEDNFDNVNLNIAPLDEPFMDTTEEDLPADNDLSLTDDFSDAALDALNGLDVNFNDENQSLDDEFSVDEENPTDMDESLSLSEFDSSDTEETSSLDDIFTENSFETTDSSELQEEVIDDETDISSLNDFDIPDEQIVEEDSIEDDFSVPDEQIVEEDTVEDDFDVPDEQIIEEGAVEDDFASLNFSEDDNNAELDGNEDLSNLDDLSSFETEDSDTSSLDDLSIDVSGGEEEVLEENDDASDDDMSIDAFFSNRAEEDDDEDINVEETPDDESLYIEESNLDDYSQNLDNIEEADSSLYKGSAEMIEDDENEVLEADNIAIDENLDNLFASSDEDSNIETSDDTEFEVSSDDEDIATSMQNTSSRYNAELEKIRQALTTDNIDISSLDEPIALDEYSDDDSLKEENFDDYSETSSAADEEAFEYEEDASDGDTEGSDAETSDEDWEWEYVEDDGNTESGDDEEWEWEYVEDDSATEDDNNK